MAARCSGEWALRSVRRARWHVARTTLPPLVALALSLRMNRSYVAGPSVILMARAYFLCSAWGLTPAQVATRAQLYPASRRRRTW